MIIYHGSNETVKKPNLDLSRKSLDFGAGFYTTVNKEQAVDFSRKVAIRKGDSNKFVNVYDFDEKASEPALRVLRFTVPDISWLNFVYENRRGVYTGKTYDLIVGPVANDDVYATLIVYEQGILNIEQTIEALKIKDLYNQYVFKTEKALSFLKFIESYHSEVST